LHTPYPRADDQPVIGLNPDYDIFDVLQEPQPTIDPLTQWVEATETIDVPAKIVTRDWQIHDIPVPNFKIWANVQEFMAEFTMPEKAAIALSIDPTIAGLRLELSTWLSEVYSNDARVIAGLDKLVELEIITETRRIEIITKD
jgi:hypothetical protein